MNFLVWFIVGIITLLVMGIISNSGSLSADNIENQLFLMNCPMPTHNVLPTITSIEGFTVVYTLDYNITAHHDKVVVFECYIDTITNQTGVNTVVYDPDDGFFSTFDNAYAWVGYIFSSINALGQKMYALGVLLSYYLLPLNFEFLGFTLDEISPIALLIIITIYLMAWLAIILFPISLILKGR